MGVTSPSLEGSTGKCGVWGRGELLWPLVLGVRKWARGEGRQLGDIHQQGGAASMAMSGVGTGGLGGREGLGGVSFLCIIESPPSAKELLFFSTGKLLRPLKRTGDYGEVRRA